MATKVLFGRNLPMTEALVQMYMSKSTNVPLDAKEAIRTEWDALFATLETKPSARDIDKKLYEPYQSMSWGGPRDPDDSMSLEDYGLFTMYMIKACIDKDANTLVIPLWWDHKNMFLPMMPLICIVLQAYDVDRYWYTCIITSKIYGMIMEERLHADQLAYASVWRNVASMMDTTSHVEYCDIRFVDMELVTASAASATGSTTHTKSELYQGPVIKFKGLDREFQLSDLEVDDDDDDNENNPGSLDASANVVEWINDILTRHPDPMPPIW